MFRIYYHDGSTYSGSVEDAPVFGVILILEDDPEHGRRLVFNGDYYGYVTQEDRWYPFDFPGMFDYLQRPGWKRVLVGRLVSNEDYQCIVQKAETDPDFPLRTAYGRKGSKVR